MRIIIPLTPTAQQRPRFARGRTYKAKSQRINEAHLSAHLVEYAHKHRDKIPLAGPIKLTLKAVMPIPPSWSKKKQDAALTGTVWPDKRPDLSNIIKQIEDVAQGILFADDKSICEISAVKRYGEVPRWEINLEVL